jgi:hypothetical protein
MMVLPAWWYNGNSLTLADNWRNTVLKPKETVCHYAPPGQCSTAENCLTEAGHAEFIWRLNCKCRTLCNNNNPKYQQDKSIKRNFKIIVAH